MKKIIKILLVTILVLILGLPVFAGSSKFLIAREKERLEAKAQNQDSEEKPEEIGAKPKSQIAIEHRSRVAAVVQELVKAADRFEQENPGIGTKVREIAQEQNEAKERVASDLDGVEERDQSPIVKFFIGPDYEKIEKVKEEVQQNQQRLQELNQIVSQLTNEGDKNLLKEQIRLIEEENARLGTTLLEKERGFSLFGWLMKLFVRRSK